MNKKSIIVVCLSVIAAIAVVFAIIKLNSNNDDPAGTSAVGESQASETLPVTSEGESTAPGETTGEQPGTSSGAAASSAETTPEPSGTEASTEMIHGDIATDTGNGDASIIVSVPDGNFESTRADGSMSYLAFLSLSQKEKDAFYDSFDNPQDYYDWFNSAESEYIEELNPTPINPLGYEGN